MTGFRKFLVTCVLGVASIMTPAAPALAMPQAVPTTTVNAGSDVQLVDHRRGHYRRHYDRHYYDRYHRRHYRPRYYRPGFGVYIAPRPIYRERYVRRGGSHVSWCLARYRSYNPATNRFLSYGGVYKVCRSPYR